MKCSYIITKFQIIDESIKKASAVGGDVELTSMLSSYLTVLISGIYEDCIEQLLIVRAGKKGDSEIESFVKSLVDRTFRNPKYDRIRELVEYLNPLYGKALDKKLGKDSIDGINTIVDNKNYLAHGRTCNLTLSDVSNCHTRAVKIFEELETLLL